MTALQRTPLFAEHVRAGARLTDFGGWEMPLHYGSQIDEHHRVRRDAGVFDVSHMLAVDLDGEAAGAFLGGLLANDVGKLRTSGRALYSCLLREDGGILDDLIAYRMASGWRLVVNAGTAQKDLGWITSRSGPGVAVRPRRDLALLALQGPQARRCLWRVRPALEAGTAALAPFQAAQQDGWTVARTGYSGEDGFEIMLPGADADSLWRDLLAAGAAPCGLGARDTLRLEAGMNLYGQDMDESVTPPECGLGWTVSLEGARAFIGRAALEQRTPRFQQAGLALRERAVPRSHQAVRTPHGAGEITSGTFSPTLARGIALARVPPACRPGDAVEVEIRGRWMAALIVKYPFVRNGKSLLPDVLHPEA
jgi:aminomethyltransferase